MQVSRRAESLADNSRTDNRPIGARQQLTIGLVVKQRLRQTGHHQRIDDAQQDRRYDRHQDCDFKILLHGFFQVELLVHHGDTEDTEVLAFLSFLCASVSLWLQLLYAKPILVISMSISLIPMNGTMIPPTP